MKKKLLTTLLGASLLLAACGGEKAADKPATTEAETIKIGAIGPLTGPVAIYGISATNGLKLAIDEINANGGILGKQVELNVLDEKGDSTEAVNAYNKLVDWGMVALVGDITSKPSVAVAEVAAQDGIPMITPTGTQLNITEAGSNVFRVCFTDPYQGEVLAKFAKEKLGAKTVAIMSNNSSDYSDGVANAFVAEAEKQGIQVVAREGYSDGDKDFKAQLTKIAQQNPDVLFIPDYYEQDGLISIQAREVGLKSIIVGSDGWDGVVKTVDPSSYAAIEDVYFANHYSTKDTNEKVQNFIKNYKEKYNDEPSAFSALSYDAAYILKAAIEKAGTTDNTDISSEEIKQLKSQMQDMQLEIDLLKETINVLKKDPDIDQSALSNKEKAVIIDVLKNKYSLPALLDKLQLSKSSYYYQVHAINKEDKYAEVRYRTIELFIENKERYGYRRIHALLKREDIIISEKIVRRIMREELLFVKTKKTRKYNSYQGEISSAVENIIDRNFSASKPNEKWLTDITEFALPAGKVYLSPIVDCFDGLLVTWSIGTSPDASLVNTMLDNAIQLLAPDEKPIVHSDRGAHYRWPGWISLMKSNGLRRSMSKKGCSPDNSACEGVFGQLKNEMFYNTEWTGVDISKFIDILNNYLLWYNEKRIKKSLEYLSPMEYRHRLGLVV